MKKIAKLSIATITALSCISTSASAVALEEAIKDVDISGYLRYRVTNSGDTLTNNGVKNQTRSVKTYAHKAEITTKAKVNDYSRVGVTFVAEGDSEDETSDSNSTLLMTEAYFNFMHSNTNLTLGKQRYIAPYADSEYDMGTGITIVNNSTPITLGAMHFKNTTGDINADYPTKKYGHLDHTALYTMGSLGPVSAQVWHLTVNNYIDSLLFAEVAVDFDTIRARAQYSTADYADYKYSVLTQPGYLDNEQQNQGNSAIEVSADIAMVTATVGYVQGHESGNGSTLNKFEADGMIEAGEQLGLYNSNLGERHTKTSFVKVSAEVIPDVNIGVDFVKGEYHSKFIKDSTSQRDRDEIVYRASYDVNKKLKLSGYYSDYEYEHVNNSNASIEVNRLRVEAKYSF
jgi:hypothetical protein